MSQPFDFDNALKALQSGLALTGKDGILNHYQTVNRNCTGC